jgi:hypothetical protein
MGRGPAAGKFWVGQGGSKPTIQLGIKKWPRGFFRKTRREKGEVQLEAAVRVLLVAFMYR